MSTSTRDLADEALTKIEGKIRDLMAAETCPPMRADGVTWWLHYALTEEELAAIEVAGVMLTPEACNRRIARALVDSGRYYFPDQDSEAKAEIVIRPYAAGEA